jgi:dTDP-4-dehydrorhamnose 3,5-epimerase
MERSDGVKGRLAADVPPDPPIADTSGRALEPAIDGVVVERLTPRVDHRGTLTEVIDLEAPFWSEPVVYSYLFTIRPGRIKGWGMHERQVDRYFVLTGEVRVVLYDDRPSSPTRGQYWQGFFTDESRGLVRIPAGVWHADQNWGDHDAMIVNFPTRPYDPANPDKRRIDPRSGAIPFDWDLPDG